MAEIIPAGGGTQTFSTQSEAQVAMKEGEAAFARRDFPAARRSYQRALTLEPRLYFAALFVGDTYFVENQLDQAQTWFARAALIDPNKESAHRYLGDAQAKAGQADTPRLSYLDAVLAEPYGRQPWLALRSGPGLTVSSSRNHGSCRRNSRPLRMSRRMGKPKSPRRTPTSPTTAVPTGTTMRRPAQAWTGGQFKEAFPNESDYRHSLAEESDALRRVARAIAADVKAGRIKEPHSSFANLIKLDEEGLLEAYVLLARPDDGIAKDYETYRSTHRAELRRYLRQYVAPSKDVTAPPAHGPDLTKTRSHAD